MLLNRMVGGTFEDVNRKRAAEVLGIGKGEELKEFSDQIKTLEPGYFFCLGRAISKERILVHVGPIVTAHGQDALKYEITPPPPPDKIKALLPKLSELPKQAEEEARTKSELKREISSLKAQLRQKPAVVGSAKEVKVPDAKALREVKAAADKHIAARVIRHLTNGITQAVNGLRTVASDPLIPKILNLPKFELPKIPAGDIQKKEGVSSHAPLVTERPATHHPRPEVSDNGAVTRPQLRILQAIAEFEGIGVEKPTRQMVASWLGVKAGTGSFKNYLSALRVRGFLRDDGQRLSLPEAARVHVTEVQAPVTTEELLSRAANIFGGTVGKILRIVHHAHPEFISREEVAQDIGISSETGSFKNYISELRVAGMVEDGPNRTIKASDWLFIG